MPIQSEKFLNDTLPMNAEPQSRNALHLELAAETLRQFRDIRFVARGSSMLPTLYPGDCLTVKSFGASTPQCGDIVLYRRAGEFRVHRIVSILNETSSRFYVLRGDSLTEDDPPVPGRDLLGRVTSLLRWGKPLEINSAQTMHQRVLRSMVRHSQIAAVLLLRRHTMRSMNFFHAELLTVSSPEAKTERA